MRTETTAWLVVSIAAITSGVIAGLQHRVTPGAVLAITALAVTAVTIVARILPQHDSSTGA